MKKGMRLFAALLAVLMALLALTACGTGNPTPAVATSAPNAPATTVAASAAPAVTPAVDLSKQVNLVYYLWGGEGPANKDILAAMNEKLKKDLNCTLEIKYIDWGDISTKYPLIFASGEVFDLSHASPTAPVSYYTLASENVLTDITDMLSLVPALRSEIPEKTWAGAKFKGKIYGVPCLYSEFTPYGYAYRDDLREKYKLQPIASLDTMEAYMAAVAQGEKFAPLNGNANDAINLYRMFTDLTDKWIAAPGIPMDQPYLVASGAANYKDVLHPAFTDQFMSWAKKMREWSDKGYFPHDMMAAQTSAKDNLLNGISAGFITHMPDWTGTYGSYQQSLPGIKVNWWSPAADTGKVISKPGVDNSTVISITSKNPERALMILEKFITDEAYYRLMQYGIEGREYEVVNGVAKQPAKFDGAVDGGGFAAWSLRNDRLNIPYASEDPVRYELIEKWKLTAIDNPYGGFSFDPAPVNSELTAIAAVNAALGRELMLGKTSAPVEQAVEDYRNQLKQAGIETVIAELKKQLESFTPISK